MSDPLDDLLASLAALQGTEETAMEAGGRCRPDFRRHQRKGVPEIILAEGKQDSDVLNIVGDFLAGTGRAIVSRADSSLVAAMRERYPGATLEEHAEAAMVVLHAAEFHQHQTGGRVGVMTAGTSDIPIVEQSCVLLREMGCEVVRGYDVGVAGIHRLFQPLRAMIEAGVDAVIVAAGMDGALPSVVAGLVDVPVIGLPTSRGYGMGGKGVAALLSMLQTCSPGLTVVNIDNAVGAAAAAGLIANRAAKARAR